MDPVPLNASTGKLRRLLRALAVIFLFSLGNASDAFLLLRIGEIGIAAFWIPLLWSGAPRRQE